MPTDLGECSLTQKLDFSIQPIGGFFIFTFLGLLLVNATTQPRAAFDDKAEFSHAEPAAQQPTFTILLKPITNDRLGATQSAFWTSLDDDLVVFRFVFQRPSINAINTP